MAIVKLAKHTGRFVVIDRSGLEDPQLSFKAKGLLAYLLSKPDDWEVVATQLAKVGPDGMAAVRSALAELEAHGYAELVEKRSPKGQYEDRYWIIYELPSQERIEKARERQSRRAVHPKAGFPDQGFPDQGFPDQGFPDQGFPDQGFPDQGFPNQGFPDQENPVLLKNEYTTKDRTLLRNEAVPSARSGGGSLSDDEMGREMSDGPQGQAQEKATTEDKEKEATGQAVPAGRARREARGRRDVTSYPQEWYESLFREEERIRSDGLGEPFKLGRQDYGRRKRDWKVLFEAGATVEEIVFAMEVLEALKRAGVEWAQDWESSTVLKKFSKIRSGQLRIPEARGFAAVRRFLDLDRLPEEEEEEVIDIAAEP